MPKRGKSHVNRYYGPLRPLEPLNLLLISRFIYILTMFKGSDTTKELTLHPLLPAHPDSRHPHSDPHALKRPPSLTSALWCLNYN